MKKQESFKRKLVSHASPLLDNYVPRWIILLIDFGISLLSAVATFYLVASLTHTHFNILHPPWQLGLIVGLQLLCFYFFKSYLGVVRYSSLRDLQKQLEVVATSVIGLLIINSVYYYYANEKLLLNGGIVIYGVLTFSLLFLFRIVVKGLYGILESKDFFQVAYILGIDTEDVAMASGLMEEKDRKYTISGFIYEENKPLKNRILNLPIFNFEEVQSKKKREKNRIIIVREDKLVLLQERVPNLISDIINANIKIYKYADPASIEDSNQNKFGRLQEIKIEDLLQRSPIKLNNQNLYRLYENKVILVTGAAGSIGSEIVRQLSRFHPQKVILVDQAETPLHLLSLELQKYFPELAFEKIIGNVRNKQRMREIFETFHPDVIFHAAAYKHVPMMESNEVEALGVNFQGTKNVADLAIKFEAERFVFVSTDKAVNPTNIMGASKRSAELMIQSMARTEQVSTTFITTRFGNVLGSNGSVVPYFKKQIAAGGPVTVTHPDIIRYFMTIDEACQLVLEAGGMGKGGEIFVFDMGKPVKITDLAKKMIRLSGFIPEKDIEIRYIGLRPGEKLFEELLSDKEKTIPTHHEKIMIGTATYNFDFSKEGLLSCLLKAIQENDKESALRTLKKLVPEYHKEFLSRTKDFKNGTKLSEDRRRNGFKLKNIAVSEHKLKDEVYPDTREFHL